MKNLNSITKEIYKEDRQVSVNFPLKLLAEFFNGLFIKVNKEYIYES